jgi:hypothetical protein
MSNLSSTRSIQQPAMNAGGSTPIDPRNKTPLRDILAANQVLPMAPVADLGSSNTSASPLRDILAANQGTTVPQGHTSDAAPSNNLSDFPSVAAVMRSAKATRMQILDEFHAAVETQTDMPEFDDEGNPIVLLPNVDDYLTELENEELELELHEISSNLHEFVKSQMTTLQMEKPSSPHKAARAPSSVAGWLHSTDLRKAQQNVDQLVLHICRMLKQRHAQQRHAELEGEVLRRSADRQSSLDRAATGASSSVAFGKLSDRIKVTSLGESLDRSYLPSVMDLL